MTMATDLEVPLERRYGEEAGEKASAPRLSEAGAGRKANSGPAPSVIHKVNFAPGRRKTPPPRCAALADVSARTPPPPTLENRRTERICRGRLFPPLESG
jgi:hypothetical protein